VGVCPLFLFKAGKLQDVIERVRAIADRVTGSHGLDVFNVQYRREGPGMVLRVQIDRPWNKSPGRQGHPGAPVEDSVTVEDCARVSRDLSAVLDVEDVIPAAYTLEVSSPGLDRPLRHADDYSRFTGRRAKLVMREAVDGQMFFKGRLDGIEDAADRREQAVLIVGDDGRSHRVPIGVITRANLEVEF
jgi:ribosome maturation factor RimP